MATLARGRQLRRRLSGALILTVLVACDRGLVPLPQADDPMFVRLVDIRLGMRQSEVVRQRPSIEASREGELWEAYGSGWITYGFQHAEEPRLSSVRLWMEFPDSLSLLERREGLVASLRAAYGFDPECYRRTFDHLEETRVVWLGRPNTGVSSQIYASPDGRGYRAELVVLVRHSELPLDTSPMPCGELALDELEPPRSDGF